MKKQRMDDQKSFVNIQKTIESLVSFSKIEKTMEILKSLSNVPKSFLEKSIQHLPSVETRFACGGGVAV